METNQSGTGPATLMDRGRPIEELAESVFEDLEELLSDPQRLIIVVERHDRHGEHWRDHAAQDLYVWIKGKNVSAIALGRRVLATLLLYPTTNPNTLLMVRKLTF